MSAYDVFRQVALLVFTPKCFDNYFIDLNFTDGKLKWLIFNQNYFQYVSF